MKVLVAPTFMVNVAGSSAPTATGGGTTFTTAEALAPFRLPVMPAAIGERADRHGDRELPPATTCSGAETRPAGEPPAAPRCPPTAPGRS